MYETTTVNGSPVMARVLRAKPDSGSSCNAEKTPHIFEMWGRGSGEKIYIYRSCMISVKKDRGNYFAGMQSPLAADGGMLVERLI